MSSNNNNDVNVATISDLTSLVNEAKQSVAAASSSGGGRSVGGGGGRGATTRTRMALSSSSASSLPGNYNNNNDDAASLSSFTRSIARVARDAAAQQQDFEIMNNNNNNIARRNPPPPLSPRSMGPPAGRSSSSSNGGNRSGGGGSSGGSGSRSGNGSAADASDRLRKLVQEMSSSSSLSSSSKSMMAGRGGGGGQQQGATSSSSSGGGSRSVGRSRSVGAAAVMNGEDYHKGGGDDDHSGMGGGSSYLPNQYIRPNSRNNNSRSGNSGGGSSPSSSGRDDFSFNGRGERRRGEGGADHAAAAAAAMGGLGSVSSNSTGMLEPTGFIMPVGGVFGGRGAGGDPASSIASGYISSLPSTSSESHNNVTAASPPLPVNTGGYNPSYMMHATPSSNSYSGYIHINHNNMYGAAASSASPQFVGNGGGGVMGGSHYSSQNPSLYSTSMDGDGSQQPVMMAPSQGMMPSFSGSGSMMSQPYLMVPTGDNNNNTMMYGNSATGSIAGFSAYANSSANSSSRGTRSLANSAALIPRAKFSWASNSVGTQSTVATRRSYMSQQQHAINSVPEPMHEREGGKVVAGRIWASFAWIITFPIPNRCVMRPTKDAKQAWREKVALFVIMVSCSVFFVGVFGFVPLLLCKEDTIFSMQDVWLQSGENWVVVHGIIYDVKDLIYRHPGGVKGIVNFLGKDASKLFPRAPAVTLPQKCLDMEKVSAFDLNIYTPDNNFTNPSCQSFSDLDVLLGITCHTFASGSNGTAKFLGDYERGLLSHTSVGLAADGLSWFSLYDRVYDVTYYVKSIKENQDPNEDEKEGDSIDKNPAAYLTPTLNKVIMNSLGGDATELYEALFGSSEYIACLEEMFYIGLLKDEFDTFCYTLNIMMYVMLVFVATLMVIQFLASMIYICPRHRTYSEEDVMSPVMIMVPCYNEGDNELRKTIKSVLNTTYPDENKVLFMVADGLVTGNGEDMSTPEHLANILGFDIDEFEDDTFEYDCIGVIHTKNRARVYHGILQKGHKFLKYIAVVKCGLPEEATTSAKPGNRGKRDSQLVIMGYYNRIHYGRSLTELDSAIQRAMVDLNLQADMVRFLMAIDADTRVDTMSITHMVYAMDKKEKVLALCGETKVDNKASSWVTMIQVFEYYNSHHLKKAFEAAFGCVTCLPGCFTMYRIIADDGTPLLPGDGVLYEYSRNDIETLHEKNLYHLGEDRMLTTLLLKYYPDRSLTFIPEAACWTIVPHTFRILLSQRRRWINSTVHNMFELLKVNTMCGVCCVSMKVVVFIDLIATMILPASYVYAMYLVFLVIFQDLPVSIVLLILYGIIMGVQVVVFILRSRWEYLWWFFIYFTIGLPVFYLVLPTYSFWNMDDFSWGKTRAVGGNAAANVVDKGEEEYDEDDDDDEDADRPKKSHRGYGKVNGNDPSVSIAEESSSDDDSDDDDDDDDDSKDDSSDDDSDSEYSDSQARSGYFSRASKRQGPGYRVPS